MIHRLAAPTTVNLVLNKDCNHKCAHCYNPWRDTKQEVYEINDYKTRIDIISEELVNNGVWSAILTGGEPLMHSDVLFYCIKRLSESGISMGLNTNLTLINQKIIDDLKVLNWQNIVLTSLPSLDESICDEITGVKGSYKRIINGIKLCTENGLRVGINTVLTKKNIDDLPQYASFIDSYNIEYVSISAVIPPVYDSYNNDYYLSNEDYIELAETLLYLKDKKGIDVGSVTPIPLCVIKDIDKYISIIDTTCTAGLNVCTIDLTTGDIFACAHEEQSYGNIFDDGLLSAWNKMERWYKLDNLNDECKLCDWLFMCGGECRMIKANCKKETKYKLNKNAMIPPLSNNAQDEVNINENDQLYISFDHVRIDNDKVVVKSGYTETIISKKLYGFCLTFKNLGIFNLSDIRKYVQDFESAKPTIIVLMQRGIIRKK